MRNSKRSEFRFAALQDQILETANKPMGNLESSLLLEELERQFESLLNESNNSKNSLENTDERIE